MNIAASTTPSHGACTCFRLRKLARTVSRLYDQRLAACGLRTTQYTLLMHLLPGPTGMTALATDLGMERTTLTRNLRPLIGAGWVSIAPGEDARQRMIELTDAGRATLRGARQAWRQAQADVAAALGADTLSALHHHIDIGIARLSPLIEEH